MNELPKKKFSECNHSLDINDISGDGEQWTIDADCPFCGASATIEVDVQWREPEDDDDEE